MSTPSTAAARLPDEAGPGFQRRLTLFDATMLIVGSMIGSGIFIVSADIARDVGGSGWLLLVWGVAGLMTILGALAYAELAAMMPHAGGQYVFLREAYSPMWGFLYGWTCFLVIQTGSIAAVGVAFAKFLGVVAPALGTENVLVTVPNVNVSLWLPWLGEFFTMKDFTISAGQLVAVGVIVLLTWVNCLGVQEGKTVQNVFTVAKTIALLALIAIGLTLAADWAVWAANWEDPWFAIGETAKFNEVSQHGLVKMLGDETNPPTFLIALMVMGGAMVGALFSADAWNNVTFIAGEVQEPRRNLARSLVLGTGAVIVLYLLANVAFLAALPIQGSPGVAAQVNASNTVIDARNRSAAILAASDDPDAAAKAEAKRDEAKAEEAKRDEFLAEASTRDRGIAFAKDDRVGTAVVTLISPTFGAYLMAVAIMISTFGCVNGMTLMGARLYYAMARDGLFFRAVGGLNSRGVPAAGLILQGFWSILLVFSGSYNQLLDFVIFAVLVFYVLTVVGLFVLRWRMPNAERPVKAFGYPLLPAIYVLLAAAIMVDLLIVKPLYTWPGLVIVLSGIPVYFLWRALGRKPEPSAETPA